MMKQSAEKTTSKNAVKTVIPSIWRTAGGKYSLIMLAIWLVVSAIRWCGRHIRCLILTDSTRGLRRPALTCWVLMVLALMC